MKAAGRDVALFHTHMQMWRSSAGSLTFSLHTGRFSFRNWRHETCFQEPSMIIQVITWVNEALLLILLILMSLVRWPRTSLTQSGSYQSRERTCNSLFTNLFHIKVFSLQAVCLILNWPVTGDQPEHSTLIEPNRVSWAKRIITITVIP